jgi:dihydroflavonol-4-reductase
VASDIVFVPLGARGDQNCISTRNLIYFNTLQKSIKNPLQLSTPLVKALVTGGTGFIGSHLVELLLQKNYSVRCLIRKTSDTTWLKGLPVEFIYGDLFDGAALREAVSGVDYVYHSAGLTKAKTAGEYFQANATGTKNLLDATQQQNPKLKRFVFVSSGTAAGPSTGMAPITEEAPANPITTYGRSKREAEEECLKAGSSIPVTIVRPPAVYGPRDKDIFEFFSTISKGLQPVVGFGEKYVSLIHVNDLVRGFVLAAECEKAAGQTYFISSKEFFGWEEIGKIAKDVMDRRVLKIRIPEPGVYVIAAFAEFFAMFSSKPALINFEKARDMVQDYWTFDASKAKRDFGFEDEIPLREGIKTTVDWYREHGWL